MGHAPSTGGVIPTSHRSPGSRMPLPQTTSQSLSVAFVAPGGQQLSGIVPDWTTMGVRTQAAEQVPAETSMLSAQVVGRQSAVVAQAPAEPRMIAVSQVSSLSTTPFPHDGEQSGSASPASFVP